MVSKTEIDMEETWKANRSMVSFPNHPSTYLSSSLILTHQQPYGTRFILYILFNIVHIRCLILGVYFYSY